MSQEHDKSIHSESAPFEPGYQVDSLPKISVPDLPDDAQGLTAEALAQVPTLTEQVDDAPGKDLVDGAPASRVVPVAEPADSTPAAAMADELASPAPSEPPQDTPVQADTWVEELHVRMGKLTDDIQTLNVRLDRLDEQNKAKA